MGETRMQIKRIYAYARAHTHTKEKAQIVMLDFCPVYTYVYHLCVHALTC